MPDPAAAAKGHHGTHQPMRSAAQPPQLQPGAFAVLGLRQPVAVGFEQLVGTQHDRLVGRPGRHVPGLHLGQCHRRFRQRHTFGAQGVAQCRLVHLSRDGGERHARRLQQRRPGRAAGGQDHRRGVGPRQIAHAGIRSTARRPPRRDRSRRRSPPCDSTTSRAMVRPRPGAAGIALGLLVQADERLEHLLAKGLGDARAVIVDGDLDHLVLLLDRNADPLGIAAGIVDQIAQAAMEGGRPQWQDHRLVHGDVEVHPTALGALAHAFQDGLEVGRLDQLAALAAGEAQILLDQLGHLANVLTQSRQDRVVAFAQKLELELHAGQRSAQIVADRRQHLGALADMAQDAVAHQVEGVGGLADLQRTSGPEIADVAALAEAVGGAGELADRADLQAQEEDRDRGEHDRAADHPGEQKPGGGAGDPLPRRDHLQQAGV